MIKESILFTINAFAMLVVISCSKTPYDVMNEAVIKNDIVKSEQLLAGSSNKQSLILNKYYTPFTLNDIDETIRYQEWYYSDKKYISFVEDKLKEWNIGDRTEFDDLFDYLLMTHGPLSFGEGFFVYFSGQNLTCSILEKFHNMTELLLTNGVDVNYVIDITSQLSGVGELVERRARLYPIHLAYFVDKELLIPLIFYGKPDLLLTDSYGNTIFDLCFKHNDFDTIKLIFTNMIVSDKVTGYLVQKLINNNDDGVLGKLHDMRLISDTSYNSATNIISSRYRAEKKSDNYRNLWNALTSASYHSIKEYIDSDNINTQDKDGWTPLMYVAYHGDLDLVKYLVNAGANIKVANKSGKTATDIAYDSGQVSTAKYLESLNGNSTSAPVENDAKTRLKKLKDLFDSGYIDEKTYKEKQEEILKSL